MHRARGFTLSLLRNGCDELRLGALRDEVAHGLANGVHAHRDAHSLALCGLEEASVLDVEGDKIQLCPAAL
ncbi:hypothetical protein D3C85_1877150 [compost metagenome]